MGAGIDEPDELLAADELLAEEPLLAAVNVADDDAAAPELPDTEALLVAVAESDELPPPVDAAPDPDELAAELADDMTAADEEAADEDAAPDAEDDADDELTLDELVGVPLLLLADAPDVTEETPVELPCAWPEELPDAIAPDPPLVVESVPPPVLGQPVTMPLMTRTPMRHANPHARVLVIRPSQTMMRVLRIRIVEQEVAVFQHRTQTGSKLASGCGARHRSRTSRVIRHVFTLPPAADRRALLPPCCHVNVPASSRRPSMPNRRAALFLLVSVSGCLGGEGGSSSSSSGGGTGTPLVSQQVGTGGGRVETTGGEVALDIPAGAVAADVTFTVATVAQIPEGAVGMAYEIGPEGTLFAEPVTITLQYDAAALAGASPADLRLAFHDGLTWQVIQGSAADTELGVVSGPTTHLSTWGVVVSDTCSAPDDATCGDGCDISCAGATPVATCEPAVVTSDTSGSTCVRAASCQCRAAEDTSSCSVPDFAGCGGGCSITCSGATPVADCYPPVGGSGGCRAGICTCVAEGSPPDGGSNDGGIGDGGISDGGISDGGVSDGGPADGGISDGGPMDGGPMDGGPMDGGPADGGIPDGGTTDGGPADGGISDGGPQDGGPADGGISDGGAP